MGILAAGSAHARHEWKFFCEHVCKVTFNHLPQPIINHIQSFGTLRQLLKNLKSHLKNASPKGARGVPKFGGGLIPPSNVFTNKIL